MDLLEVTRFYFWFYNVCLGVETVDNFQAFTSLSEFFNTVKQSFPYKLKDYYPFSAQ